MRGLMALCVGLITIVGVNAAPYVMLKADDVKYDSEYVSQTGSGVSPKWKRFIDLIAEKDIKAGLGVICNSLETDDERYTDYLKELIADGRYEIWHHGYDHALNVTCPCGEPGNCGAAEGKCDEFCGSCYDHQYNHLLDGLNLAKEKLDYEIHSFGAPGNHVDETTEQAISQLPQFKVWMNHSGSDLMFLNSFKSCRIERNFEIDYEGRFLSNYNPDEDYYCFQVHPHAWDETRFTDFERCIDYLIEQECTFVNPYEYYCIVNDVTFAEQARPLTVVKTENVSEVAVYDLSGKMLQRISGVHIADQLNHLLRSTSGPRLVEQKTANGSRTVVRMLTAPK